MELRAATVAVTGVTGFLGRYIADSLLARGARVLGVVRSPDRVPELAEKGVELRRADLAERDRLTDGFRGADAVISNAALFSLRNQSWDDHLTANVGGTENVLEAARAAGVRRVTVVSSVAVYRRGGGRRIAEQHALMGEATPPRRTNAYALSKALAERSAWRIAGAVDLELTVIRPSGIYGAHDPNFTRFFRALMRLPISVYPAFFSLPMVYAGDVAEAAALALERPQSVGKAYNVAGEDRTAWDFARAWRRAGGRAPWLMIPIPVPYRRSFDTTLAREELHWRPRSYLEGLLETLASDRGDGPRT